MEWNEATQDRFNALRVKKFTQTLDAAQEAELALLLEQLEQKSEGYLSPLIDSLEQENNLMLQKLGESRQQNATLIHLIAQQEKLVTDARRWLTELESRHTAILQTYQHIIGEPLVI